MKKQAGSKFPYLPIHLSIYSTNGSKFDWDLEALVDTGFSGDVVVPRDFLADIDANPVAEGLWQIADGTQVFTPSFAGVLHFPEFSEMKIQVGVNLLGGEVLIGRGITDRFKLTLDHGQTLTLEL